MMRQFVSIALVLVMLFAMTVSASALISPGGKDHFGITVGTNPSDGSLGGANTDKNSVTANTDEDGNVTLTADEKNNGKFSHWEIEGEYDIIEGSLTDKVIVIRPKSDIHAIAVFEKPGTPDSSSPTESKTPVSGGNTSNTSPKTGDSLYIIFGLAVLALGAGALAVKKIKE